MKTGVNQHNYKAGFIKFLVPVICYLAFETAGNATEIENKVYKSRQNINICLDSRGPFKHSVLRT